MRSFRIILSLCLLLSVCMRGQENDTIDRLAPDFVTASFVVAEPGTVLYTVLGHACMRLQCPTYDMDYFFSYESEAVPGRVLRFLMNDLKMGMAQITPEDFLQTYIEEGRGVKAYTLNLPPEVKTELWRICDERVAQGMELDYDPVKRGCAISMVHCVEEAIGAANRQTGKEYRILYPKWGEKGKRTIREIFYDNAAKGWGLFWCMTIVSGRYVDNPHIPMREKLIAPKELVEQWQKAYIDDVPILASEPIELTPSVTQYTEETFSPIWCGVVLLLLALLNLLIKRDYLGYILLGLYLVFSVLITYLLVFSALPNTDWNWLIIPFNILPVIFWYWRKYWALPYAAVIAVWCIAMLCAPHRMVEYAHILMALSFMVVLLKQCRFANCKKQN